MGKLESIATLATIAAGGLIFLKVYPLVEGFLKPAGDLGGGIISGAGSLLGGAAAAVKPFIPVPVYTGPLRTFEPVPDVRYSLTEDTEVIPGTDYPVSPQRLQYQEAIGVPFVFPEQLQQQATPVIDFLKRALPKIPQFSQQVGGQPTSGTYWINPLTQGAIAPYIAGEIPQGVLDLRSQDILPAIRSF